MYVTPEHQEVVQFMCDGFECQSGGIYAGRDGREPREFEFRLSTPVRNLLVQDLFREQLADPVIEGTDVFAPRLQSLHQSVSRLNLYDVNRCLESLNPHFGHLNHDTARIAVQGVSEFLSHLCQELKYFPEHPRLFRFGQVFPSKGMMQLALQAAEDAALNRDSLGVTLIEKLRYSFEWNGEFAPQGKALDGRVYWRPPALSLSEFQRACDWIVDYANCHSNSPRGAEALVFLCNAVQEVSTKVSMMTGDGYEKLPGTRLFSTPGKAISRVMIEHALLTSSPAERLESAKVGAILIAIGGSVLTRAEMLALGVEVDGNTYGMPFDRQMQSGLRILRLINQLALQDTALSEVLKAYDSPQVQFPGAFSGLIDACGEVWERREVLQAQLWEEDKRMAPEFLCVKDRIVKIISNDCAGLDQSGEISWRAKDVFPSLSEDAFGS